jgi:hypothetical protein
MPEPPGAQMPRQRWYDLDLISLQMDYWLSRTYFGGEALPVWNAGYSGVAAIPALLGCRTEVDMDTGWWDPILTEPDKLDCSRLVLDESHSAFQFMMATLRRAAQETRGKSLPSIGAFGGGGDTLAALRGTEQLLLDCMDRPAAVRAAEDYLMDMWCDVFDRCYAVIRETAEGSTSWFTLWSPGKFYPTQNDFSYNIGPVTFRELFLPAIRRQTEFLDHTVYHVDGVDAFRHVDAVCALPRLQALQIVPGAGKPSPLHYLETLRKVQSAGKNLHITLPPEEVEPALSLLSARGLFIHTWTETEDEARALLRKAEQWSVDR